MDFRKAATNIVLPVATAIVLAGCAGKTPQPANQILIVYLDHQDKDIHPRPANQDLNERGINLPPVKPGQKTPYIDQTGAPVSQEAVDAILKSGVVEKAEAPKSGAPVNPVGQQTAKASQTTAAELDSLQLPSPPWVGKADNVKIIAESGQPFLPPKETAVTTTNPYQIVYGSNNALTLPAGSIIYNNNVNPGDETTITLCVDREGNPVYAVSPLLHFLFQTSGIGSTSGNRKNDGFNVQQLNKLLDRYRQLRKAGFFHVIDKNLRERLDEYGLKHPTLSNEEKAALKKAREKGVFGQKQASLESTQGQPQFRGKAGKWANAMKKTFG